MEKIFVASLYKIVSKSLLFSFSHRVVWKSSFWFQDHEGSSHSHPSGTTWTCSNSQYIPRKYSEVSVTSFCIVLITTWVCAIPNLALKGKQY